MSEDAPTEERAETADGWRLVTAAEGTAPPPGATTVVAQGTFDLLHPGHVHYLREAAAMGDHLTVIVARVDNVTHKQPPVVPATQRRRTVAALAAVDRDARGVDCEVRRASERPAREGEFRSTSEIVARVLERRGG
ncbi:FAD synthase [Halobacteriales archaeon SW_7_71_33]|nr:MAG: FAD synthase [Halobacteriales archaeon SW_7_71_33]